MRHLARLLLSPHQRDQMHEIKLIEAGHGQERDKARELNRSFWREEDGVVLSLYAQYFPRGVTDVLSTHGFNNIYGIRPPEFRNLKAVSSILATIPYPPFSTFLRIYSPS